MQGPGELLLQRDQADHDLLAVAAGGLGADVIGNPSRRDLDQPCARILWKALAWPLRGCRDEGFLDRILRGGKVAKSPNHRAKHLRREVAQKMLGIRVQRRGHQSNSSGGPLITWRTSIDR